MKILIVEDNPGDQALLKDILKNMAPKAKLTVVEDADQATAILQNRETANEPLPKIIILDLNLPKKNGKEFLKELKANQHFKKIPVLVLTSSEAESDIAECYALGASCYLKKPTGLLELQGMVEALCQFWLKEVTFAKINSE